MFVAHRPSVAHHYRDGMTRRPALLGVAMCLLVVACSSNGDERSSVSTVSSIAAVSTTAVPPETTSASTTGTSVEPAPDTTEAPGASAATTTVPAPTTSTTSPPTTTITPATSTTPTTSPSASVAVPPVLETVEIGTSVEGRPITAIHRGTPGGPVVLVIGVIHGDEHDGLAILDDLESMALPPDVDLWLVESMNPDGLANDVRHNANAVDLNRNFPYNWGPIGEPGNWEYSGPSAASEPETQAMVAFITDLQPDLTIWYHQDYFRISPSTGREGQVRARYSELTGIPLLTITGGTYTGVAATWARTTLPDGVAFIVELGATLAPDDAAVHARAVLTIASELD